MTLSVEKMALFTYPREQLPDRPGTQFFYPLLTQCMHVMLLRYISKKQCSSKPHRFQIACVAAMTSTRPLL